MTRYLPELLADTIWLHLLTKPDPRVVFATGVDVAPFRYNVRDGSERTLRAMLATWKETALLRREFVLSNRPPHLIRTIKYGHECVFTVVRANTPEALAGVCAQSVLIVALGRLKDNCYPVINSYAQAGARLILMEE